MGPKDANRQIRHLEKAFLEQGGLSERMTRSRPRKTIETE